MNMDCKVCGAQLRGGAKFCNKCGVPLSIFARLGSKFADSKSEMTIVAGHVDDNDVPTVDSPSRLAPTVESPATARVAKPPARAAAVEERAAVAETRAPKEKRPRPLILSKPAQTILFVFIFASLPLFIPSLANMLGMKDQPYGDMLPDPKELITFKSSGSSDSPIPGGGGPVTLEETFSATGVDAPVIVGSEHPVEDPAKALDSFYAQLSRTDARQAGAITRITHYGDSPITNDGITSTVRRLLQTRFGDAGHGFILMDRPWAWYGHDAITFTSGGGWDDEPMGPASNADEFGLGGVSFRASGPGKYARYAPAATGETGKNFSRMEVYYLQEPSGGQFNVIVNGESAHTVSTSGDAASSGFHEIKAPQSGANTFEVRSAGGTVELFGAVLENDGPGVVYDSLGVNGAYAGLLVTAMNQNHWAEQLRHRNPSLVVINYGTNESQYASPDQMQRYEKDLREVIRRVRVALPNVSILVVSPMDRGKRAPGGKIITMPSIPLIVEMQRRVALEENCAFFNTFKAMGGEGTMAKWAAGKGKNHLVGGDLTHPTAQGAEIVGSLIYEALNDGYTKFKARAGNQLVAQGK